MPDGQKSICRHCEDKEAELYIKQEFELQELKVDFARLWTQCQRCQGNMQEKVICSNSGMLPNETRTMPVLKFCVFLQFI